MRADQPGIGSGALSNNFYEVYTLIDISGGTVNATGHDYAPGIGYGDNSQYSFDNLIINISGG